MSNVIQFRGSHRGYVSPIDSGGDGPHDGDMEARVTRLESDVGKIREDLATIKERLVHMPTSAQLWKAIAVGSAAVIGVLWATVVFIGKPWAEQLLHSLK